MTGKVTQLTILGMAGRRKASTPATYRREFASRVKAARIMSKKKQAEIAEAIGVKLNTYQTWEGRSLMPHQHVIPFCYATKTDPYFLLTGIPFDLGKALPPLPPRAA